MLRHTFVCSVTDENFTPCRQTLGAQWEKLKALLDAIGAKNFSLWQISCFIFGYYETAGEVVLDDAAHAAYEEIMAAFAPHVSWVSDPSQAMRLMYQDYGIVREDKSLIRERVFATKLKPGMQEEYRERHRKLEEARGDAVSKGPNSNFSIWNAADYIFGYCEFDTTMEGPENDESRKQSAIWEEKMLEIMDWLTNDVDWLTGTYHVPARKIARHN